MIYYDSILYYSIPPEGYSRAGTAEKAPRRQLRNTPKRLLRGT